MSCEDPSFPFLAGLALGFLLGCFAYKEVVIPTSHYIDDLEPPDNDGDEEI
jgi:hypothetical protein